MPDGIVRQHRVCVARLKELEDATRLDPGIEPASPRPALHVPVVYQTHDVHEVAERVGSRCGRHGRSRRKVHREHRRQRRHRCVPVVQQVAAEAVWDVPRTWASAQAPATREGGPERQETGKTVPEAENLQGQIAGAGNSLHDGTRHSVGRSTGGALEQSPSLQLSRVFDAPAGATLVVAGGLVIALGGTGKATDWPTGDATRASPVLFSTASWRNARSRADRREQPPVPGAASTNVGPVPRRFCHDGRPVNSSRLERQHRDRHASWHAMNRAATAEEEERCRN